MTIPARFLAIGAVTAVLAVGIYSRYAFNGGEAQLISMDDDNSSVNCFGPACPPGSDGSSASSSSSVGSTHSNSFSIPFGSSGGSDSSQSSTLNCPVFQYEVQKFLDRRPLPGWSVIFRKGGNLFFEEETKITQDTGLPVPAAARFSWDTYSNDGGFPWPYCKNFFSFYEIISDADIYAPAGHGTEMWYCREQWGEMLARMDAQGGGMVRGGYINGQNDMRYYITIPAANSPPDILCSFYNDTTCRARSAEGVMDDAVYDPVVLMLHANNYAQWGDTENLNKVMTWAGPVVPRPFHPQPVEPLRRVYVLNPSVTIRPNPLYPANYQFEPFQLHRAQLLYGGGSGTYIMWANTGPWRLGPHSNTSEFGLSPRFKERTAGRDYRLVRLGSVGFNNPRRPSNAENTVWLTQKESGEIYVYSKRHGPDPAVDPRHAHDTYFYKTEDHDQILPAGLPYAFDVLEIEDGVDDPAADGTGDPEADRHFLAVSNAGATTLYEWNYVAWGQGDYQTFGEPLPGANVVRFFVHGNNHYLVTGGAGGIRLYRWDATAENFALLDSVTTNVTGADRLIGFERGGFTYVLHGDMDAKQTILYRLNGDQLETVSWSLPQTILHTVTTDDRSYLLGATGSFLWTNATLQPVPFVHSTPFPPSHDWGSFIHRGEQFIVQSTTEKPNGILRFYRLGQCATDFTCHSDDPNDGWFQRGSCLSNEIGGALPVCGNGLCEPGEDGTDPCAGLDPFECDLEPGAPCAVDCNKDGTVCGDGICEPPEDEEVCVDPPDGMPFDPQIHGCFKACQQDCTVSVCGDGVCDVIEQQEKWCAWPGGFGCRNGVGQCTPPPGFDPNTCGGYGCTYECVPDCYTLGFVTPLCAGASSASSSPEFLCPAP